MARPFPRSLRRMHGFTLVELVVTLALLGLMAAMAAPLAELTVQRQKEQALHEALRDIRGAIDRYKLAAEQGLVERQVGDTGYPKDLYALENGIPNQKSASKELMRFLRKVPRDPFNPNLGVPAAESWTLRSSSSPPDAPAPGDDVFDVITHAQGAGLNGVPYKEW